MKYNRFLRKRLTGKSPSKPSQTKSFPPDDRSLREGKLTHGVGRRKRVGLLDTEPPPTGRPPKGMTAKQKEMREEIIKRFTINKINKYVAEQIDHINYKQQIADGLRLLFDENGLPPANAPLEDIVAVRKKMESEIRMLEAISSAMRVHLTKVKEIEDMAFDAINGQHIKKENIY